MLTHTPFGLDEIIETFGSLDTPRFESRYIEPFTLPYPLFYEGVKVTRARCHHLIIENFQQAFEAIKTASKLTRCFLRLLSAFAESHFEPWFSYIDVTTFLLL